MKKYMIRIAVIWCVVLSCTVSAFALPRTLIPGGCTVGVKLYSGGLIVTGFEKGSAAREAGLEKGDVILQADGLPVHTAAELRACLKKEQVILTLLRGEKKADYCVKIQNGELGIQVQDSVAGIGTVTYYDPNTGNFGALGHGVSQTDTDHLVPMEAGIVVKSQVVDAEKGEPGEPGELKGKFDVHAVLGEVSQNSDFGLFGVMSVPLPGKPVEVADRRQVETGPAEIWSNVEGERVQAYSVEILKICPYADHTGRNLLLRVTDPELLSQTGGIIQGMSGSPILQNGRIVGAVTHVLVNDPTRGYGIFIENMLNAAG